MRGEELFMVAGLAAAAILIAILLIQGHFKNKRYDQQKAVAEQAKKQRVAQPTQAELIAIEILRQVVEQSALESQIAVACGHGAETIRNSMDAMQGLTDRIDDGCGAEHIRYRDTLRRLVAQAMAVVSLIRGVE